MTIFNLLNLIKNTKPDDAAGLAAINLEAFTYFVEPNYREAAANMGMLSVDSAPNYCESRDALRKEWPDDVKNFFITTCKDYDFGFGCDIEWLGVGKFEAHGFETECLAELYCLVQAINKNRALLLKNK